MTPDEFARCAAEAIIRDYPTIEDRADVAADDLVPYIVGAIQAAAAALLEGICTAIEGIAIEEIEERE